ncbi:MAG TPA: glycosyltransferase family A protein [Gemmatimonadota bacterium]|nr:glycosyltransferase family A protein [Gemmatimonadota bacterium]
MIVPGLVTTIVPVHNRPAMLAAAVESVLAQAYRPLEVLVVDDGSTDDTPAVAHALSARHPEAVRVLHIPNGGPGVAREAGRRSARGEFLQYLDSDDVVLPGKFERQVEALREDPECGVSYGRTRYVDGAGTGTDCAWRRTGERIEWMFPSFLAGRWWGTSTPLYRRSVTDLVGPWTSLWNEEDWEYDCRVAALGRRLAYVPHFVSEQRGHSADRLSRDGSSDPAKLRDRAAAHALILGHAESAGIEPRVEEMRRFARELFLLSRQCGAAGLEHEARHLHGLARRASRGDRAKLDLRLYGALAAAIGWRRMGRLACARDRRRAGRDGQ